MCDPTKIYKKVRQWGVPKSVRVDGVENIHREICSCETTVDYKVKCFVSNFDRYCKNRNLKIDISILASCNTIRELSQTLNNIMPTPTKTLSQLSDTQIFYTFIKDFTVAHPSLPREWAEMQKLTANSLLLKQL